jgi:tRNA-specific 2-thiouridylase
MARIVVAMSGGVDSSVAALLLAREGHDVIGVFMRNGVSGKAGAEKSCCSASDARDAALVAERLGVPFYAIDYEREFGTLMDHFAAEYRLGRTPNPCVLCNQELKFGHVLALGGSLGAEAVATGHYARADGARLLRARDERKDQTYYLFGIDRAALPSVRFPLGELTKDEVRAVAREAGLVTSEKPESMEICFVTSGRYRDVVRARGGAGRPGAFTDEAGRELGRHDGIDAFTVGQRSGLPALGAPRYVKAIDARTGTIVLAARESLLARGAEVAAVRWLVEPPSAPLRAEVKIRARSRAAPALVVPGGEGRVRVDFDEAQSAVTPGQAAVFYAGDVVLGGGWIEGE